MSLAELQQLEAQWTMPTYARLPVELVRGEGCYVWDGEGNRYLDFVSGISVTNLGHCHPAVVEAIREQAGQLIHASNLYYTEPALRLAQRLSQSSLGGKVFLCNSGTEANEAAIKLARRHAVRRGIAKPEIVVLEGAFHGRTFGALAATPKMAREDLFGPMLPGFRVVSRDDAGELGQAVGPATAAVMIEPVQGEAGVYPIADEVLAAARAACDEHGALLVFDEIQCGMGRTGTLWAYEQTPVAPDVLTTAKALGGGLPIGACITAPRLGDILGAGDHGSTFAGGSLVARAALAALEATERLVEGVEERGSRLEARLRELPVIAIRRRGLMVGCDVGADASRVVGAAVGGGLVINAPGPGSVRLLPPLTVGSAHTDAATRELGRALEVVGGGRAAAGRSP